MAGHRNPCVTTVYDFMLEVDVVQQPRFWAKFSRLTLTACGPSGFGGSALSHCVCFSGLAFCFLQYTLLLKELSTFVRLGQGLTSVFPQLFLLISRFWPMMIL